jgi:hypothetical protein
VLQVLPDVQAARRRTNWKPTPDASVSLAIRARFIAAGKPKLHT